MIAWSILAAQDSGCFDYVIVSTDDAGIAEVAESYGAIVPFIRPAELSEDYTPIRPVIVHALTELAEIYGRVSYACCIYATAPLLEPTDIKCAYESLIRKGFDFVFTATEFSYPVQRALKIDKDGLVSWAYPEAGGSRSQDLEPLYHDAGQFYWGKADAFLSGIPTVSSRSEGYLIPHYRVQDIDTDNDWTRAEHIFSSVKIGRGRS